MSSELGARLRKIGAAINARPSPGYRIVRFTWRQITREPERVAATLRELLAHAA